MFDIDKIDFNKNGGLVPAIIQDDNTANVLMLGYMNKESLLLTLETGLITFWSRSKNRIWQKGEVSGNTLKMVKISQDCDYDSLLIQVLPNGSTCHTGTDTCWGYNNSSNINFLSRLQATIKNRKTSPQIGSYTSSLFDSGINKIAQKVGEEAIELVIESKDNDKKLFLNEAADLMYHYIILLVAKGFSLESVVEVLESRNKMKK